jgi:hypothetical protein
MSRDIQGGPNRHGRFNPGLRVPVLGYQRNRSPLRKEYRWD